MATLKQKRDISDLINHMKQYKDAVLIIGEKIAPELNIKRISDEEGENSFNRKSWVKNPGEFWKYYLNNIYKDTKNMKEIPIVYDYINQLLELGLIKSTFSLNTHGVLENAINLKGTSNGFKCSKCGELHTLQEIKDGFIEDLHKYMHLYPCKKCLAKKIRPTCLMYGENYLFEETSKLISDIFNEEKGKEALPNTHTVIYLGVDMDEDFVGELIDNYVLVRDRIEDQCFNVMITDSANTVALFEPEFATHDDIEGSLKRLIDLLK